MFSMPVLVQWQVGLGQLSTQMLSVPLLGTTGEENRVEILRGPDKNREITYQLPSKAKQTRLGED